MRVARGHYVGIHASTFKDFLLKPELLRAVVDCGFEHPSEVQQECIPQAVLGMDVICQAKSGMGKTAVFVLATLHQLEPVDGEVAVLVMCHTRELAYQIKGEYDRFSKYLPGVKSAVIYGGIPEREHITLFTNDCPHIVVATPGRIKSLVAKGHVKLDKLKHFVLDECDSLLEELGECQNNRAFTINADSHPAFSPSSLTPCFLCVPGGCGNARHAPRPAADLQGHAPAEAGHDVLGDSLGRGPARVQEVLPRRETTRPSYSTVPFYILHQQPCDNGAARCLSGGLCLIRREES